MIFGKNKELIASIDKLLVVVDEGLKNFSDAILYYQESGIDGDFSFMVDKVKADEDSADYLVSKSVDMLFSNFLLPEAREDIAILTDRLDDIIDNATHTLKYIQSRKLKPSKNLTEFFKELMNATLECYRKTAEVTKMAFESHKPKEVLELADKVFSLETTCDTITDKMIEKIYESEIDGIEKMLITDLIEQCGTIADSCEDTAEIIRIMTLKRVI